MGSLLLRWLLSALALLAVAYLYPGVRVDSFLAAVVAALALGLANALIRPILVLLTLPVTIITLGLFLFVVNDTAWQTNDAAPDLGAAALGRALLETWVLPFEIASVLLTAALVGAIMLTRSAEEEAEDALA